MLRRPNTPAQMYATVAAIFLIALGVLSLLIEGLGSWGAVDNVANRPQFLIWAVSGWTSIFWIAMGALALFAAPRLAAARTYALLAAGVFAVFAVWGFIDGNNVMSIFAADTTNNITHAVLAGPALVVGIMPRAAQPPHQAEAGHRADGMHRFSRTPSPQRARESAGSR
jgi:Domain of unknown function (DUF4383)